MSLNDRPAPQRPRWPAQFDVEGIPRDSKTRTELVEQQRIEHDPEAPMAMSISRVAGAGTFDFNNPPHKPYVHQEYPRVLYKGKERRHVKNDAERDQWLAQGWELTPNMKSLSGLSKPKRAAQKAEPVEEAPTATDEEDNEGGISLDTAAEEEEDALNATADEAPAKSARRVHHMPAKAHKKK